MLAGPLFIGAILVGALGAQPLLGLVANFLAGGLVRCIEARDMVQCITLVAENERVVVGFILVSTHDTATIAVVTHEPGKVVPLCAQRIQTRTMDIHGALVLAAFLTGSDGSLLFTERTCDRPSSLPPPPGPVASSVGFRRMLVAHGDFEC